MLKLTRMDGESIFIGDEIIVTVIAVDGYRIKLGIEAPRDVPVHRAEITERIRKERIPGSR